MISLKKVQASSAMIPKRLIVLAYLSCLLSTAWSQTSSAPSFEKAMQYAATFTALNEKLESNYSELDFLLKQIAPLNRNLQETEADLRGIEGLAFETSVQQQTAIATADATNVELNQTLANGGRGPSRSRAAGGPNTYLTEMANIAGHAKAEAFNLQQVQAQLNLAQQATIQRRLKVLNQLQDIARQVETRFASQQKYTNETIEHVDTAGKRSRLELRAALHALSAAGQGNVAATLARGITLLRLDQLKEAESTLDDLVKLPAPISTVALAARAELYSRLNKNKDAKSDLGLILNSENPAVITLRARAWAIMGMNSDAIKNFEQLAKHKSHQHVAWSSLALLQCSGSPNPNLARKALEQSQLADDLASGTDWYYKMAVAFAQAANKDLPKAAETAHQAASLAIGDKREVCLEIAQQFEAGQNVKWKW